MKYGCDMHYLNMVDEIQGAMRWPCTVDTNNDECVDGKGE